MSKDLDNHLKIALASIQCFTDDGTLDVGEVNYLIGLALANDNEVDDEEKKVLASIFDKVSESEVTPATWSRIKEIRAKYSI